VKPLARLFFGIAVPVFAGSNAYIQHNLIADTPGNADVTDPNLVNPWGISETATSPFWISDNGTGLATVYSTSVTSTISIASLKPAIPPGASDSSSKFGPVSGQVANSTTVFVVGTAKASFLFCTEDGTISGWNGGTAATIKVDNSSKGAVYKGMSLGGNATAPQLYVANFHAGTVEVYDGNFAPVTLAGTAFTDPQIPSGFAPFNIVNFNSSLYVAYAKQGPGAMDDAPGPGNGYVDIFDMSGNLKTRLIAGGSLNSPWGMAIAPANFGVFANMLLVGNFGDGHVNVYDPALGTSLGALQNPSGAAIAISGLWALQVGNGKSGGDANAVYFTAGPGGETHGLFGSLQAGPVLSTGNTVVNGASFQPGIAEYSWITILGSNLSSTTRIWNPATDFVNGALPKQLDGVGVTVDGKPAYVYYISPVQINALVPADSALGTIQVSTANQTLGSASVPAAIEVTAPAFFTLANGNVAALHANNTVVGPTTLYPNNSTPAAPGETIELYATGFGPGTTTIPDGQVITTPIPITGVTVTIGGAPAQVTYQGLVQAGVYQINAVVPASTPTGNAGVTAAIGGQTTQSGVVLAVQD
jgi:uncharacterized protein (TIGR03118 family)